MYFLAKIQVWMFYLLIEQQQQYGQLNNNMIINQANISHKFMQLLIIEFFSKINQQQYLLNNLLQSFSMQYKLMISDTVQENGRPTLIKIEHSYQQPHNELFFPYKPQDFCLGRFASQLTDIQRKRSQTVMNPIIATTILVEPTEKKGAKRGLRMINRIKRMSKKKKNPFDYRKNICGYITKKVIRQFTSADYQREVELLCRKYNCDYVQAKLYYAGKIQHVTGPSHIPSLLVAQDESEQRIKLAFRQFFQWFLRQHYLRYILMQGKMSDKKAYIEYKNNTLLSMLQPQYINMHLKSKVYAQRQKMRNMEKVNKKVEIPLSSDIHPKTQYLQEFPHTIIHVPVLRVGVVKKQQEQDY